MAIVSTAVTNYAAGDSSAVGSNMTTPVVSGGHRLLEKRAAFGRRKQIFELNSTSAWV